MAMKPIEELSPRRQRRRLRNRDALKDAALKVFERDGFVAPTIADIIQEADVGRGTFYNYFDSKEEVFNELLDELVDELVRAGTEIGDETSVRSRIEIAMGGLVHVAKRRKKLLAAAQEAIHVGEDFSTIWGQFRDRLEATIQRDLAWCERHGMLSSTDTDLLGMIVAGMIESTIFLLTRPGIDASVLERVLCETYWNALFGAHEGADDYTLQGAAQPKAVFA